ncbi:hypothetical protein Aduo_006311 [Ancylostoma duodenale]
MPAIIATVVYAHLHSPQPRKRTLPVWNLIRCERCARVSAHRSQPSFLAARTSKKNEDRKRIYPPPPPPSAARARLLFTQHIRESRHRSGEKLQRQREKSPTKNRAGVGVSTILRSLNASPA